MPIDDALNNLTDSEMTKDIDIQDLKKRIKETDLSVNNSNIQIIFEKALKHWVTSYEKKQDPDYIFSDVYGSRNSIPNVIWFEGDMLSPLEIYLHVELRDTFGMKILKKIEQYRDTHTVAKDIKTDLFNLLPGEDLDKYMMVCSCGYHNMTYRQVIESVIDTDLDSPILSVGLTDSIKSLYAEDKYAN
jgi:hypothetical protein